MQAASVLQNQQRPRCVIDPALALSPSGLLLYKNLGKVMELWIVRELWYILDNINLYLQRPELVIPRINTSSKTLFEKRASLEETLWSLKEWERIRGEVDLSRLNLFWLGDNLRESLIPQDREPNIFSYWESLARSLDSQINQLPTTDVLTLAFRDAIALTASLGSAFILTYQIPSDYKNDFPPDICKTLESWNIPCQYLTEKDPIVVLERENLRRLITSVGLAKLFWADIHIVVLHLVENTSSPPIKLENKQLTNKSFQETQNLEPENYLWRNIQGFWYQL
ncbi:MAG: hypothetical protein KI793_23495 [Rivularia sp. (in: Bacteria)]|nr:hypothetical protein [Rivularia sp. MS3]